MWNCQMDEIGKFYTLWKFHGCFASLIVPLNMRGGLKRLCRRRAFLSYHKAPSILPRYPKISQRYHKDINKILQSTQQRHCVDLVYFWYHSPWILNIKVRSCVLYPCIIRRYPYAKGKYLVQMLVQQKGLTKLLFMISIRLKGFFMFYKFHPSLQVKIICTH